MATRILTVDDSAAMRRMLACVLEAAGYGVLQAEDGAHGMEMLSRHGADLIITDINMPRLDGFGLIMRVRRELGLRAVPILVLTTEDADGKRQRGRRAGANAWMLKPFEPVRLIHTLHRLGV
ncbi:MAG: response regulator [Phenylobacterium zucineum]|nr:MAG: response regulator [Phenylobacterium zucineum]